MELPLLDPEHLFPDGWFLIGDAARTVDPLYSTGLSMTVVQVQQITEIIRRQKNTSIAARLLLPRAKGFRTRSS